MMTRSSKIILFFVIAIAVIAFGLGVAGARAPSDKDFVKKAAGTNQMEITLGQIAERQAASPEVRQFGQRMVQDHGMARQQLQEIASKHNLDMPRDMDRKEHRTVRDLSKLSGRDFDRQYMRHMITDHKEDVKLFEQMAKDGKNPDLRNHAQQTLPNLQQHLQMAQDLYNRIERQG